MRILVLFPGALGDFCLLAPALAELVARGVRLELSIQRSVAPVAAILLPNVLLGPPLDGAVMATLFGGDPAPAVRTWMRGADRVIAWLARGGAADEVEVHLAGLGIAGELHAVPRAEGDRHAGAVYAAALGLAGAAAPIQASAPPVGRVQLPWRSEAAPRLVMHPGAGAAAKRWPAEGFQQLGAAWVAGGGEVVVLLGPAEEHDRPAWGTTEFTICVDREIVDAAVLVASAPHWIGNDSGMSHLAAALGRHGVVLFGPTRPERWMPRGGRLRPVRFAERPVAIVAREALACLRAGDADSA